MASKISHKLPGWTRSLHLNGTSLRTSRLTIRNFPGFSGFPTFPTAPAFPASPVFSSLSCRPPSRCYSILHNKNGPPRDVDLNDVILQRSLSHKPITDSTSLLRCTVFDSHGNVSVVSGEFKRNELLSKHGLLPRDLRKLDKGVGDIVPSILVRKNSVLISLLHIRALIKSDMVLIFDAHGSADSHTQSLFMYDLGEKLRQKNGVNRGLPYEFRALEAIFFSVVTTLDAEMKVHTTVINGILAELEDYIDREKLRYLLIQSKKLSAFYQKAQLIRDVIDELLDQDDDLAGMYLTEKAQGKPRKESEHAEVEMLLESYYKHFDEIVQTVGSLVANIRSTEEIVNIILDANRNQLMLLGLRFSIGTLALGGGAFFASLYGMNLKNFLEDASTAFVIVSGCCGGVVLFILFLGLRNLHKIQRVTMMSENLRSTVNNAFMTKGILDDLKKSSKPK